ncbi:hypothetical protein DdX_16966 [Ditylenchus destructor]|uniref:F-box domain-containing protein n=1 Tax=Ditylenchus destructor TaxID=166010 RepID=A0AAD4MN45_9BILA|nr:hypothetical protein DdX_16966 [Ditylenchus destructor]
MPPPLTFIVNVFNFLDRNDLEIVSNTGNYVNRIVRKHFPSKPYRFLNDVTMEICRDEDGLTFSLKKYADDESSGSQDAENQSTGYLYLDPYKNEWMDEHKYFALEIMRPYLSQFVRFGKAYLFCEEHPYTTEDMTILASISHVWSGRSLWLCVRWKGKESQLEPPMNFRNNASNSLHNILSNDAIFSARCLELHDAAQFVSLQDYSRVYTVDVLLLKSYNDEPLNIGTLLALIEHKPQFPESKTVFVVDISTFETREAEVIRESFSSASTPCPFQLVIK